MCDCAIPVKLKRVGVQTKPETKTQNNTRMTVVCASIRPEEDAVSRFETSVEGCKSVRLAALRSASIGVSSYENRITKQKSMFGVCTVYSEITALCFIDLKITQYVIG